MYSGYRKDKEMKMKMKGNQLSSRDVWDVPFSDTTQTVYIYITCMIIIQDKNYVVNNNFHSVALFIREQIDSIREDN